VSILCFVFALFKWNLIHLNSNVVFCMQLALLMWENNNYPVTVHVDSNCKIN
jgi:hypothetical protein